MVVNLVSLWGFEVLVALCLSRSLALGAGGVWWGRTVANLANCLLLGLWFRRGVWKRKRELGTDEGRTA